MLVDDEPFNINALQGLMTVLKMQNMNLVDVCFGGEQAVALMQKAIDEDDPDRYGLIITDICMPFMDGCVAAKKIREMREEALRARNAIEHEDLLIIAVTGQFDPEYIERAKYHEIDEVFSKPISVGELGCVLLKFGYLSRIPNSIA